MADWTARMAAAFHSFQSAASHAFQRKIKSTPFAQQNGNAPLNASGVVQVGPRRFVFVDNHDSAAPSTNSRSTPTVRKYIGYGGAQWWALKRDT